MYEVQVDYAYTAGNNQLRGLKFDVFKNYCVNFFNIDINIKYNRLYSIMPKAFNFKGCADCGKAEG